MPFCANFQVLRKYRGAISHAGHAARFAPLNITVTAIAPRPFASDMNINARDHGDAVARQVPAGRIGCDDDMGGRLSSRAGDYVVGATLSVDGVAYGRAWH
jgi:NAD(P)-dependent dehydrogenase (short-subunit alcohol dehydrogenase family)